MVFDGDNIIGVYDSKDYYLNDNLINNINIDFSYEEKYVKAFIQDYMSRIIDKKLD